MTENVFLFMQLPSIKISGRNKQEKKKEKKWILAYGFS